MRGQPVVGQHGARVDLGGQIRAALDRLGVGAVQLSALAREQVVVNGGAGQCVPESVSAPRLVDHQQLVGHRLAQRRVQVSLR